MSNTTDDDFFPSDEQVEIFTKVLKKLDVTYEDLMFLEVLNERSRKMSALMEKAMSGKLGSSDE